MSLRNEFFENDMRTVYVAGPMSGLPNHNVDAFRSVTARLREEYGVAVVSPVEMDEADGLDFDALPDTAVSPGDWEWIRTIARDLQVVRSVDAVVVLPGWEKSRGAYLETRTAVDHKIEVYEWADRHAPDGGRVKPRDLVLAPARGLTRTDPSEPFQRPQEPAERTSMSASAIGALEEEAPASGETRVVDPDTGGQKGQKLARFDLVPPDALTALAEHYGRGAQKYDDNNWLKGYDWKLSFGAMMRHAWAWWGGEDTDDETGSNHMTAVAWHAIALYVFQARGLGKDTR